MRIANIVIYSKIWIGVFIIAQLAIGHHVQAQTTAYASDQVGNPTAKSSISASIPVTAQVLPTCTSPILATANIDLGALDRVLPETQIALNIQCSGAFRIGLVSSNGGLRTAMVAPSGYSGLRDYNLALYIRDNTNANTVSLTCPASSLAATAISSNCSANLRGPATGLSPGFKVNAPSNGKACYLLISNVPLGTNTLVAATDYADILTINVTAAT